MIDSTFPGKIPNNAIIIKDELTDDEKNVL